MKLIRALFALAAGVLWSGISTAALIKTIQAGATDQTVVIRIVDSTDGTPETGVAFNTSGIDLEYWRHGANSVTDITEATQTVSGAHTDGGFVALGNGYYRLDLPDAAVAAGATAVEIMGTVTGMVVIGGTVDLSPPVNTVAVGGTAQTARDLGASVLISSGTGTGQLSVTSGVIASNPGSGTIAAADFAAGAIDAAAVANGAIDAATFAADVDAEILSYIVDDATRIDASELNADIDSLTFTVAGDVDVNVQTVGGSAASASSGVFNVNVAQVSTDSTAADTLETWLDGTTGPVSPLGIARQGTAQSATGTTLVLDASSPFADDTAIGMTLVACGSTQGYCQSRAVTDYVNSTDTATVETWTVTPSGTITYYLFGTAPGGSGSGLDAAGVRSALGMASANMDTQLSGLDTKLDTIDNYVDTEVAAILDDTGTSGVVVASGSKTGYALSASGVDAIWDETQSGHVTAGSFGVYLDSAISGVSTGGVSAGEIADAVWDEATSGHATGGTFAVAVTDILTDTGTTLQGEVDGIQADTEDLQSRVPAALVGGRIDATVDGTGMEAGAVTAIQSGLATAAALDAVDNYVDTEVAAIKAKTDSLTFTTAGNVDANVQYVNDVAITGDGSGTPFNVVTFRQFKRAYPNAEITRAAFKEMRDRAIREFAQQHRYIEAAAR